MAVCDLPWELGRLVCTVYTRSVEQLGGEDDGQGGNQGAWFGPGGLNAGAETGKLLQPGEIGDARFTTLSTFLCFEPRQTSGG